MNFCKINKFKAIIKSHILCLSKYVPDKSVYLNSTDWIEKLNET